MFDDIYRRFFMYAYLTHVDNTQLELKNAYFFAYIQIDLLYSLYNDTQRLYTHLRILHLL